MITTDTMDMVQEVEVGSDWWGIPRFTRLELLPGQILYRCNGRVACRILFLLFFCLVRCTQCLVGMSRPVVQCSVLGAWCFGFVFDVRSGVRGVRCALFCARSRVQT